MALYRRSGSISDVWGLAVFRLPSYFSFCPTTDHPKKAWTLSLLVPTTASIHVSIQTPPRPIFPITKAPPASTHASGTLCGPHGCLVLLLVLCVIASLTSELLLGGRLIPPALAWSQHCGVTHSQMTSLWAFGTTALFAASEYCHSLITSPLKHALTVLVSPLVVFLKSVLLCLSFEFPHKVRLSISSWSEIHSLNFHINTCCQIWTLHMFWWHPLRYLFI